MNNIDCNIIKDLLPLYLEGLVSDESKKIIEEHLSECEQCQLLAGALKPDIKFTSEDVNAEIDYLKKVRAKRKTLLIATVAVCVFVFGALLVIGAKVFLLGTPIAFSNIDYDQNDNYVGIGTKFNPETNELTLYGEILYENWEVSRVKVELDKTLVDVYDVTVYIVPRLFAGKEQNASFKKVIKIPDDNEVWSVYSMGSSPHDLVGFWSNADIVEEKVSGPKAKLTEYLTAHGEFSPENNRLEYSYFGEIFGEPSYVFYLVENIGGADEIPASTDCAISENGVHYYLSVPEQDSWELLNK